MMLKLLRIIVAELTAVTVAVFAVVFFEEKVLPRMHCWLSGRKENPPSGGVDEILILWNGEQFAIQELHYA